MRPIRRGTEIYFKIEVRDFVPVPSALIDPDGGVFLVLKNPAGATVLSLAPMSQQSAGVYIYRYQTLVSSPLGVWSMEFKAVHGTATHLSLAMGAFELVSE